jgi:hypothetical protein
VLVVKTLDRWSAHGKGGTVGYAVLNLFADARSSQMDQPTSANVKDFVLNSGGHQLPLHTFPPPEGATLSASSLDEVPAVACATILVRLHMAVRSEDGLRTLSTTDVEPELWAERGLVIPAPDYRDGVYDSVRCGAQTTEQAANLYNHRLQTRKGVLLRDMLQCQPAPHAHCCCSCA